MIRKNINLGGSLTMLTLMSGLLGGFVPASECAAAPTVTATSPASGASGVPVGAAVTATFSEAMNPASITGTTVTLSRPVSIQGITAGWKHSVVRKQDGGVIIWGDNQYGQTVIPAGLTGVTGIAAGNYHTLALKQDGTLQSWGLDHNNLSNIPSGLGGVKAIAAGGMHNMALKQDGTITAWGYNAKGQVTVPAGLSGVSAVAGGGNHSLALKQDGTVVGWGDNANGQSAVPAGLSGVIAIAAGWDHSLALKQDGTVAAWGYNLYGQSTVPADLTGVTAIAAGWGHSLALKQDGTVAGWGGNDYGQVTIPTGLSGVAAIAVYGNHSLALKQDGTIVTWGSNDFGESTPPTDLYNPLTAATVTYDAATNTATLTPSAPLAGTATYRATVTSAVSSAVGVQSAADFSWNFTTGDAVYPVNGACGSSNGGTFTAVPTANLCISGTASTVTGSGPWSWSCAGQNGGTEATCSATIKSYSINFLSGGNGSITGTTSQTLNHGASATAVTAVADSSFHFTGWTGTNGFAATSDNPLTIAAVTADQTITANFANDPVNGACGSSSGGIFTAAPAANLCGSGTASSVSGSGPWNWSCAGIYGGTEATCSASLQTYSVTFQSGGNGTITGATAQTVNYNAPATAVTAVAATDYHFVNWTGTGGFAATSANPLTLASVTSDQTITANFAHDAVNGACGASNGLTLTAAPADGFCSAGSASTLTGSGPWSWSCAGQFGGTEATCNAAIKAYSVSFQSDANGSVTGTATQTVNHGGSAAAVTAVAATDYHFVNWTGTGGFAATSANPLTLASVTSDQAITANFTHDAVNGVCGTSNGLTLTAAPADGFCSTGSASALTGTGPWSWSCAGQFGGTEATCSAAIKTYSVSFQSDANGSVTGTANQTVNHGASATAVTAVAATGYHFVNWTGTGGFAATSANPLTVAGVTADQSITANFAHDAVNGACGASNGLTLTTAPADGFCSVGTASTLTGTGPWSWSCVGQFGGTEATCSAAIKTYTVTFQSGANGSVTGTATQTVNHGGSATAVTATPATGFLFVNWSGTGGFVTTSTNPLTVASVTANQTITANFAQSSVNAVCGSSNGGTFTVTPNSNLCTIGSASSVIGSGPWSWSCSGQFGGADASCSAYIKTYKVSFLSGANGSITGTSTQTVNNGAATTAVTAVAAAGYHFVNWTGTGGFVTTTTNPLTLASVTADQTITANFVHDAVNGTCGSSNGGTFTVIPAANLCTSGTASTVTGSGPWSWSCAGQSGGTTAKCSAAIKTYTITFKSGSNGKISGTTTQTVKHGGSAAAVTATANNGYHFVNWTGTGGFVTTTTNPVTVTNVTASQSITANFAKGK